MAIRLRLSAIAISAGALALAGTLVGSPAAALAAYGPSQPISLCTPAKAFTTSTFSWTACDITDLDQIRRVGVSTDHPPGVPGGGWAFCAPTAAMNAFATLAARGLPIPPGSADWTAAANYDQMTRDIDALGGLMRTTTAGTGGAGFLTGIEQWTARRLTPGSSRFAPLYAASLYVAAPRDHPYYSTGMLGSIAQAGANGSVVLGHLSFYQNIDPATEGSALNPPSGVKVSGGHVVTVAGASQGPSGGLSVSLADPATPLFDHTNQAPYTTEMYSLALTPGSYNAANANPALRAPSSKLPQALAYPTASGQGAFLDGYTVISRLGLAAGAGRGIVYAPAYAAARYYRVGPSVAGLAFDPLTQARMFFFGAHGARLGQLNLITGQETQFAAADGPVRGLATGGREPGLYALTRTGIVRYTLDGRLAGRVAGRWDALAMGGRGQYLVALSRGRGRLDRLDDLLRVRSAYRVPAGALARARIRSFAIDDRSGEVLLTERGGGAIALSPTGATASANRQKAAGPRVKPRATLRLRRLAVSEPGAPRRVMPDGHGHILSVIGSRASISDAGGRPLPGAFAALPAAGPVAITQDYSNVQGRTARSPFDTPLR